MAKTVTTSFSINEALSAGWAVFKRKWLFILGISLLMLVIQFLPSIIIGMMGEQLGAGGAGLINLAGTILNLIVSMGWLYILIQLVRGRDPRAEDLFSKANLIFKYIGGTILAGLIVVSPLIIIAVLYAFIVFSLNFTGMTDSTNGTISFIMILSALASMILMFYLALKYAFVAYAIVDRGVGPIAALKLSSRITAGVKWKLLGFMLVTIVLNILGLLALGVGLLVTIPVTTLAYVKIYDLLLDRAGE